MERNVVNPARLSFFNVVPCFANSKYRFILYTPYSLFPPEAVLYYKEKLRQRGTLPKLDIEKDSAEKSGSLRSLLPFS